jgi:23S rRNA pseudouridine2605 synthase
MSKNSVRLHKYLADHGIGSRRRCELHIEEGHVRVNGVLVTTPGTTVDGDRDTVEFDGRKVEPTPPQPCTILLNKPRGYICSASARQGKTVFELIEEVDTRLVPVGRLDKNSEGLLLLSNDGHLVNTLTHPRFDHEKEYKVTVSGPVNPTAVNKLRSPMIIDGYRIRPAKLKVLKRNMDTGRVVLGIALKEGRNRQIRKMCDMVNLKIHRLIRTRIGNLRLSGLKAGEWRPLDSAEIRALKG